MYLDFSVFSAYQLGGQIMYGLMSASVADPVTVLVFAAHQLSSQIMYDLGKAVRLCENLFGPGALRLARVLTELGRQHFSLEMDDLLHPHVSGSSFVSGTAPAPGG